ncbi:unnamed protein product [Sphagnum balticum]
MFTGFIPSYIKSSASLLILNISHNLLTGDPSTLFDSEVQTKLAFVDMSENQMVGELGDEIFKLPAIQVVAAAVNCLRGPISDNICTANTLKTIALDSMGSASSCLTKVFPIFNTYAENIAITGSLPYCMFNLSMLNTLHLSNNGIEGTLPYDLAIGPDLVDLDLSHNTLKGKLPREICAQNWNNLNLGYNRLDGTLCDGLVVDEKLVLERNRLSGNIPPSYNSIPQISILSDNIFDCSSLTHATLPHLDPASGLYACGSETANISFYIYGGIGLIALVTIVIIYQVYNLDQQLALFTVGGMKLLVSPEEIKRRIDIDTSRFGRMSTYLLHVAGYVGLYLAFGLMVTVLMTHAYSTHDESYAWEFSFGYKGGERAAGVIVVYIGLMAILFYYLLSRYISSQFRHFYRFENLMTSEEHPPEYVTTKHAVFMFSLFLINLIVTVTVNIYFVLNITGVSRQELYLLDLGLAAFKIVWTNVFIDGALNAFTAFLLPLIRGILRSVLRVAATYSHTSSKVLPDSLQDEDFRNSDAIYDPEDADVDNDDSYEHQLKSLSIHYRKSPIEEKYESYEPAPSSPHNKRISDHFKRDNALSVAGNGCNRKLDLSNYHGRSGNPYCNVCFDRLAKQTSAGVSNLEVVISQTSADVTPQEDLPRLSLADRAQAFKGRSSGPPSPDVEVRKTGGTFRQSSSPAVACAVCGKTVYQAEQLVTLSVPYCEVCFDRLAKQAAAKAPLTGAATSGSIVEEGEEEP